MDYGTNTDEKTSETTGDRLEATEGRGDQKQPTDDGEPETSSDDGNNLFGLPDEHIDFQRDENFSNFKDVFKTSKISKAEYNTFLERIMEEGSPRKLHEEMEKTYGRNYERVLKLFTDNTASLFSAEEQKTLNSLPARVKVFFVRAVEHMVDGQNEILKRYGLSDATKAIPSRTSRDYRKDFAEITRRLMTNDYRTADEYEGLKRQRIELGTHLAKNN
jgi:hypothetical protein